MAEKASRNCVRTQPMSKQIVEKILLKSGVQDSV